MCLTRIEKGSFSINIKFHCKFAFAIKLSNINHTSYPIAQRLFAMRRYGGGILYAALPLHMQRGCFRIRTHDQQVTKAQLYRCTRARPQERNFGLARDWRQAPLVLRSLIAIKPAYKPAIKPQITLFQNQF